MLTHGFTLDEKGNKMSKSLGNTVAPDEVVDGVGDRLGDELERRDEGEPADALERVREPARDVGDVVERHLDGQEERDRDDVEHVVDDRGREGALEFLAPGDVGETDQRVGDGRADVCAHDDGDGVLDAEGAGGDSQQRQRQEPGIEQTGGRATVGSKQQTVDTQDGIGTDLGHDREHGCDGCAGMAIGSR